MLYTPCEAFWLVVLVWFGRVWFGLVWFINNWFGLVWFGIILGSFLVAPRSDDLYDLFPLQHYSSCYRSSRSARQGRYIPDVYDLPHVAG